MWARRIRLEKGWSLRKVPWAWRIFSAMKFGCVFPLSLLLGLIGRCKGVSQTHTFQQDWFFMKVHWIWRIFSRPCSFFGFRTCEFLPLGMWLRFLLGIVKIRSIPKGLSLMKVHWIWEILWAVFFLLKFGFVYASGIVTQGFCKGVSQTLSFKKDWLL